MTEEVIYEVPAHDIYRLVFPRGRFIKQLEDDLTIFIQLIERLSGLEKEVFKATFDKNYAKFSSSADKTIANHRTEMITLFGLTRYEGDLVFLSNSAQVLLETQDFPLFFKSLTNNFQFPNLINKWTTAVSQAELRINFKPAQFILRLLKLAEDKYSGHIFYVSGQEISNLVFNDIRVAKGERSVDDVLATLISAREAGISLPVGSNMSQHGREFLHYMTLANLLKLDESERNFCLNHNEKKSIDHIIQDRSYVSFKKDLTNSEVIADIKDAWERKFKTISTEEINVFKRTAKTIQLDIPSLQKDDKNKAVLTPHQSSLNETGDEGERYVLKYEKELVGKQRPDKLGLVARVANDTSLGYDIQSLELPDCNKKKYIEVKSTIRTFPPSEVVLTYFPMSGNEWETARHYQDSYYIYRVVLLGDEVTTYVVQNPVKKYEEGKIFLDVKEYRVTLKHDAVDSVYSVER